MKHVGLVLLLIGVPLGCQRSTPTDSRVEGPLGGLPSARTAMSVQIANGARRDATLRAAHFDGSHLNSLGRAKLDAMVAADRVNEPLTVFVDAPGFEEKRDVVTAYLLDRGVVEEQLAVKAGSNPDVTFAAAPQIASLPKLETGNTGEAVAPPVNAGVLPTVGAAIQAISK